jgi:hypothetical protein
MELLAAALVLLAFCATVWLLAAQRAPTTSTPDGMGKDAWWAQALVDERACVQRSEWVTVGKRRLAADVVRLYPKGADAGNRCLIFFPGNPGMVSHHTLSVRCFGPRLLPC